MSASRPLAPGSDAVAAGAPNVGSPTPGSPTARSPDAGRLIAALDTSDRTVAERLAGALAPHCALLKLGLEFFCRHGPDGVAALDPARVFLDLKLHDIPATVGGAARAAGQLGPAMLTVHAAAGAGAIAAARDGLEAATPPNRPRTRLLAVTVLTSLDAAALRATGVADTVPVQVERLARLAIDAGADGIVCSAAELAPLRAALGPAPLLVVPGIRPDGAARDDQARVATPAEAIAAGASFLVIGRPITRAPDPAAAAAAIARTIEAAIATQTRP